MNILLIFILIASIFILLLRSPNIYQAHQLKMRMLPYSGVNSDKYYEYIDNINKFTDETADVQMAAGHLYRAISNMDDISRDMYDGMVSSTIDDDIDHVAIEGEKMLMYRANLLNQSFKPKYLNNKIS